MTNTTEYERATIMGTYQVYSSGGVSGDYRGVQVNASGQIILASGLYVASGLGVVVQSGINAVTTVLSGSVAAIPFTYEVSKLHISGTTPWAKIGYNSDVDSAAEEDLIVQGGKYVFPSSGIQMMIKSTATGDRGIAPIGSGAWSATIYYLDSGYLSKTETITINGTSGANTVATDILRVNNLRVTSVGGNAMPIGNLSLTDLSGTKTYGYISSGQTRQRQCVYTVPASNTLYITSIGFGITGTAAGKDGVFTTRASWDDKAGAITSGFMMPLYEIGTVDAYVVKPLDPPTRLGSRVDLKVSVNVGNNTSKTNCVLQGWLE